jgi:acetoin utilization protein AcuB
MLKEVGPLSTHRLITIETDASLKEAYTKMESRKVRHLPVVDPAGRIVGILSDRDVKRAMLPERGMSLEESQPAFDERDRVSKYMSWPAKGVDEHTAIEDVVRVMLQERISSLLIVSGPKAHPTGIVTTDDLLRYLLVVLEKPEPKARLLPIRDFFSRFHMQDGLVT